MAVQLDRRQLFFAALSLLLPRAAEAQSRRAHVEASQNPWQVFQQNSVIEGVYSSTGGSYVVVKPKLNSDAYRNPLWQAAINNHPSLSGFFESNSDNEGALFFLRNNQEPLIAQNIVGYGLWDNDSNADLARRHEGRDFLSILRSRNVLGKYEDGIVSYDDQDREAKLAALGMTLSFNARDAVVLCGDTDEVRYARNADLERVLKEKLARSALTLANLVPAGLATREEVLVDNATGNAFVITKDVESDKLRIHVVNPQSRQIGEYELTPANPARRAVSTGGANYFYRTAEGHSFVLFKNSIQVNNEWVPQIEASFTQVRSRQRTTLSNVAEENPMYAEILRARLSYSGRPVVIGSSQADVPNNPAVVRIASSCDVTRPARPGLVRIPPGFSVANRNDGG